MRNPFRKKEKNVSKLSRYQTVFSVLAKYGFEDLVSNPPFDTFLPAWRKLLPKRDGRQAIALSRYERIRMILEELGPTYIKFGQLLSNRKDLLPEELAMELARLQDDTNPLSKEAILEVIEEEYQKKPEEIFKYFNYEPLASASIAQVHRAELPTGDPVVIKIQRPNIRKKIMADIKIMNDLAKMIIKRYPEAGVIQPLELIKSFEASILNELDFTKEAINIRRFAKNFREVDNIYVPLVYRDFCTEKIICMEYIEGIKASEKEELVEAGIDIIDVSYKGTDLFFKQIFDHGFFHADPHPGNLYVLYNGKICYLDYGMMGNLMPEEREDLGELLINLYTKNIKKLGHVIQKITNHQPLEDTAGFERDLFELVEEYEDISLKDVHLSEIIERFRLILYQHNIPLPPNFYLLLRAMVIIEGVGYHLNPDFDIMKNLKPYAEELMIRKYNPVKLAREMISSFENFSVMLTGFPQDFREIVKKIKKGKLHIQFEHRNLEPFYKSLDVTSNRVSFAIVVAALIIGSALIVLAKIPPFLFNIPVIGLVGFIVSGLLALWLLISILRHGKI